MSYLDIAFWIAMAIGLAFLGGSCLGYNLRKLTHPAGAPATSDEPRVVVNVPADFKPLDKLPPTAIEGARASLYWTVLDRVWDDCADCDSATKCAEDAVRSVFGSLHS